jgi:V8-like Glu-specific endopeptidase
VQADAVSTVGDLDAYWTDQRMANAAPAKVVLPGDPVSQEAGASGPSTRAGPIPYSSYELPNTTGFPERVHGKVFFTKPGIGNFVCSGTVVNGTNDSTVITAGHCVFGGSGFWTNWVFVPGYRKLNGVGDAPFGTWSASNLLAPTGWTSTAIAPDPPSPNYKFDYGAAVINRNTSGLELEDVVGARGIAFGQSVNQHFISHGYPAGTPFDGFKLWACESDFGGLDLDLLGTGPATMAIGCDMTGGSSGGGWVIEDAGGNGFVNSVNSYKYGLEPEMMFGPYFDSGTQALFNSAQGQAPGQQTSTTAVPPPAAPATPILKKRKCSKPKRRGKKKRCKKLRR